MKKLLVFIFFVCSVCGINYFQPQFLYEFFASDGVVFYIYSNSYLNIQRCETVQNGSGSILKISPSELKTIIPQIDDIGGESVVISNQVSLNDIIQKLKLEVVDLCNISNGILLTGYSPKLPTTLYSNNDKINVQILVGSEYIIIGYPLIMQGF